MIQKRLMLVSPFLIIGLVHIVTTLSVSYMTDYLWMVTAFAYWILIGLHLRLLVPAQLKKEWFQKPVFRWKWLIIGLLIGLLPVVGILLPNLQLMQDYPVIVFFVLLFAWINPWLEEMYWRGALLEAGSGWPVWLNVLYSTLLFVMSHPLMWGVFSIGNRSPHLYLSLFLMGVVWAVIRYRTKSLRWPIYSHILVDIGNLSVFVFLNIYIPPGMS